MKDVLACNLWLYKVFPFLRWLPRVNRSTARSDLIAGLTGAIIVLPQGVAFATIAGMPPEYGLYAAMVPAIIAALFGSSWHLVSGPTTAISIVIFATVSRLAEPGTADYISLVLTITFLTGVFQFAMGLARMGTLINFISHTVVIGFTAGAAILIASSQIKNFFGIPIPRGSSFYEIIHQLALLAGDINLYVTSVGIVTLLVGVLVKKFFPKFPYMIAAMIAGSVYAVILNQLFGVDVTHIRTVGALPAGLPPLSRPDFSLETIKQTASSALAITMLALTEAVSISRAIAVRSEQRIDGNQEFIGQGLSNILGSFFSGYASSGSFNRSGLNYEAGARTPLAAMFASGFLILILLMVAPLAAYLPIPAMAAILFMVGYGLIDFHHMASILKTSRAESVVLVTTLLSTLFVELEFAIYVGVILSLMLYLNRTSRPQIRDELPNPADPSRRFIPVADALVECPQIKFMRVNGSVFFGAVNHVQQALQQIDEITPTQKNVVLLCDGINFIDVAGAEMLGQESRRLRKKGGGLYLYGVKETVTDMLEKGGYLEAIGKDRVHQSKPKLISSVYTTLDPDICRHCPARIFTECHIALPNGEKRDSG